MGGRRLKSGRLFGRKKSSAAAAPLPITSALPPSSSPDSVLERRLDQFDLRLKQLEENQVVMVRQPAAALPPSLPSSSPPPPPPPPSVPTAGPVASAAAAAAPSPPTMHQSNFSAELRRAAEAATLAHRQQRQPQQQHPHHHHPQEGRQHDEQVRNTQVARQQQQQHRPPSSSSMTSALREANLRGTLMERLRQLENRIFQLSFELAERNSSSRGSSSDATRQMTWSSSDKEWALQSMASSSSTGDRHRHRQKIMAMVPSSSSSKGRVTVGEASKGSLGLGERLRRHILSAKTMNKDPKQVLDAAGRKAAAAGGGMCKKEKKRMTRTRIYRRWFPVIGC